MMAALKNNNILIELSMADSMPVLVALTEDEIFSCDEINNSADLEQVVAFLRDEGYQTTRGR